MKKAVIKEKWLDDGFKIMNELEKCALQIIYDKNKQLLTFKLVQRFGIVDVKR